VRRSSIKVAAGSRMPNSVTTPGQSTCHHRTRITSGQQTPSNKQPIVSKRPWPAGWSGGTTFRGRQNSAMVNAGFRWRCISPQKLALFSAMERSGVNNSELARRLGVTELIVRRTLNPKDETKAGKIEAALRALGKEAVVHVSDAA
jgi:hypothetical protein